MSADATLRASLQSQFPDVLTVATQYGAMYQMPFITAVRYAAGLLGPSMATDQYDRLMALITAAEMNQSAGGISVPMLLAAAAVIVVLAAKG